MKQKVVNANVEAWLVENSILEQASCLGHYTTIFIASLTLDLQEHLRGF
jgi:hypothetical protein